MSMGGGEANYSRKEAKDDLMMISKLGTSSFYR